MFNDTYNMTYIAGNMLIPMIPTLRLQATSQPLQHLLLKPWRYVKSDNLEDVEGTRIRTCSDNGQWGLMGMQLAILVSRS